MLQLQRLISYLQRFARCRISWQAVILVVLLIAVPLIVAAGPLLLEAPDTSQPSASITQLARDLRAGQIAALTIDGGSVHVTSRSGPDYSVEAGGNPIDILLRLGVTADDLAKVDVRGRAPSWTDGLSSAILRWFVAFVLVLLVFYLHNTLALARPAAPAIAARNGRPEKFEDVAGLTEAKEDLWEIVQFLRDPAPFKAIGAQIPRGVLLVGPPGNGKTLLARAVAGEAGVEFLAASGSDFVEVFVGRGAARVRSLFKEARRRAPCVVFVDELDSLGRHRGSAHAENDHALNQLLVEMDGFATDQRVVVLAATNRADILDAALLRPGRFDRRVLVPPPDLPTREAILRLYTREKPLAPEVDLKQLARSTSGLSGADLFNVVNEAAILAVRNGRAAITAADLSEAVDRTLMGTSRSGELIPERERRILAYHEAGHALAAHLVGDGHTVQKVSIIARGQAGGFTRLARNDDTRLLSRKECERMLVWLLGGRVAEAIVFDDVTTGAQDDLRKVTALARAMVTNFGMSDRLGPLTLEAAIGGVDAPIGGPARSVSVGPRLAELVDDEVRALVEEAERTARGLLIEHRDRLDLLAEALLADETVEGDRLQSLLNATEPGEFAVSHSSGEL